MKDHLTITHDPLEFSPKDIAAVYNSVNFTIPPHTIADPNFHKKLYPAGVYGVFACHQSQLAGCARLFSDQYISSWISELCVLQTSHKQGVGSAIMQNIIERFGHTALYLEALNGSETFFTKFGIRPRKTIVACSRAPVQIDQ